MQYHDIESTNITKAGYDPAERRMEVVFKNGGVYSYHDVPQEAFDAFMASKSKGSHHHSEIKGRYRFTKGGAGQAGD